MAEVNSKIIKPSRRVLIIGLDGATWEILSPLIVDGHMPNLQRLMDDGSSGVLMSTIPPVTASAWSSFYTGRSAGRHGVFDFRKRMGSESTKRDWVTHKSIRGPLLWEIFNAQGKSTGLTNLPLTFPPSQVNGYMIGGMPVPPTRDEIGYPSGLVDEIIRETGEYISDIDLMRGESPDVTDPNTCMEFANQVSVALNARLKAQLYLMEKYPQDLTACVIVAPDRLSHLFYQVLRHEENYPKLEGWEIELKKKTVEIFEQVDEAVGTLVGRMSEDDLVVVMSDHGFGPLFQILKMNQLLQEFGYLKFKPEVTGGIKRKIGRILPEAVKKPLRVLMGAAKPGASGAIPGWDPYALLDWENTKAYSGGSVEQGIFINVKGREPYGTVLLGGEYHLLRDEIIEKLRGYQHPDGNPMFDWVEPREKIYNGENIDGAPDIMFCIRNHSIVVGEDAEPPILGPWSQPRAGFHRREGILVMKGSMIVPGAILNSPNIYDVAPTILACCGLKSDIGMDGKLINDAIDPDFLSKFPPVTDDFSLGKEGGASISSEDSSEMEDLLKGLGYLN